MQTNYNPYFSIGPVHITSLDLVKSRVRPVELLREVIDREAVRGQNVLHDNVLHVVTCKVWPLDAWLLVVPVGPVDQPESD